MIKTKFATLFRDDSRVKENMARITISLMELTDFIRELDDSFEHEVKEFWNYFFDGMSCMVRLYRAQDGMRLKTVNQDSLLHYPKWLNY